MKTKITLGLVTLSISLFTSHAAFATNSVSVSQGAMLSNSCSACHGTDGKSPGAIPSIYGKSAKFISDALTEFRDGKRKEP